MSRKVDFFDGASSETTPVIGNLVASNLVSYANDAAYEAGESGAPAEGNVYYNTTLDMIRYYANGAWHTLTDLDQAQTLTNKTIDGTSGTGTNTISIDAADAVYNNATSGLSATDAQGAIDEVEGRLDTAETNITTNAGDIDDLETLSGSAGLTNHGTFTGTTISDNTTTKGALQELETAVEARIPSTEKGAANGVASLDGSGQVPVSQLPDSVTGAVYYVGTWNASTNTPSLSDGSGAQGDYYVVSVAGSTSLDGITDWQINDWVISNGTVWEKIDNTDSVTESSTTTFTNKTIDADLNTISNLAHGAEVDNPSSGVHGVTGSVVGTSDTQTLTNKDIDGGTASNTSRITLPKDTTTNLDLLTDKEGTIAYDTTLGSLVVNDGSGWNEVSGSGGVGGINYILNPDAETDTTGWATYADAAAATPVDGTGGVFTGTFNRITTAAAVRRGTGSFRLTPGAQGEGCSYDFTIDNTDRYGDLTISFDYGADGSYTSGLCRVFVYDVTNATVIAVANDDDGDILNLNYASADGRFVGRFSTTDSTSYRLIIHQTAAGSGTLYFDNVSVGPQTTVPGAIVTEWEPYTPTLTSSGGGSITLNTTGYVDTWGRWRRVGDSIEINYGFRNGTGGAASGSAGNVQISFPSGIVLDTSDYSTKSDNVLGSYLGPASSSTATTELGSYEVYTGFISVGSGTNPILEVSELVAGYALSGQAKFKVNGWSAGAMLSTTETNHMTVAARYTSSAGQLMTDGATDIVDFGTVDYDTHNCVTTGASWKFTAPRSGRYLINSSVMFDSTPGWAAGELLQIEIQKNGSRISGARWDQQTTTDFVSAQISDIIYLDKDDYVSIGLNQNSGANENLSTTPEFVFCSIQELPDFSTFSVYGQTDLIESSSGAFNNYTITADQYGDLTSFVLTPGEWDISCGAEFQSNGATTTTQLIVGIGTASGNDSSGLTVGDTRSSQTKTTTSGSLDSVTVQRITKTVISPTTYYLKAYAGSSITNLRVAYKISARKIK